MDVRPEIEVLAARHRFDPRDPLLEALFDVRDELKQCVEASGVKRLAEVGEKVSIRADELRRIVESIGSETTKLEDLSKKNATLIVAAKAINMRDRISSGLIGLFLGLSASFVVAWFIHARSADAVLAEANIQVQATKSKDGYQITLFGKKILRNWSALIS